MSISGENGQSSDNSESTEAVEAVRFHYPLSMNDYDDENDLRFFCLAFRPDNKIHLFPPCKPMVYLLRDSVEKHWTVDSDELALDCYTLNLKGTPFLMYGRRENAMLVKHICCSILERLRCLGWILTVCTDLSRRTNLTAWYFLKAPTESPDRNPNLICLSLSAKREFQLINANPVLHDALHYLVSLTYDLGIDQDAHYGRDYQIKLKGSPWDTEDRDEIVGACEMIADAFDIFGRNGYHFYGSVNLKDTVDSFFFEYDPNRISETDGFMVLAFDGSHILRLAKANLQTVEVVKATIDKYWLLGLEAEGQIACGRHRSGKTTDRQVAEERVSWEFVLKGSPWDAPAAKIGQSRQLVTYLLDALLANGWIGVTGLDISKSLNKKSALLFKRNEPPQDIHHACLSPLGKQKYQLINAPVSLRRLVREEFRDILMQEKMTDHQICEMTFSGRPWWVLNPEQERDSYIFIGGRLLHVLTEAGWRLVASAAVTRQTQEVKEVNGDIHSWFLLGSGMHMEEEGVTRLATHTAQTARLRKERSQDHYVRIKGTVIPFWMKGQKDEKGRRTASVGPNGSHRLGVAGSQRFLSPPSIAISKDTENQTKKLSKSGSEPHLHILASVKLSNAMKSVSTDV